MKPRNSPRKVKVPPKQEVESTSEITRIKEVLAKVGKRVELAARLGVSESRISEFIAHKRLPTPEAWIKLGKLALDHALPDPFFFWAQAGIDRQTLESMADKAIEERLALAGKTFPISRFRETETGREEAGPPVPLPVEFVPSPRTTICLYVDEKSFSVVDAPRGLIILDTRILGTEDVRGLDGQVVMLRYDAKSPDVPFRTGLYAGRVRVELMQHGGRRDWMQISVKLLSLAPWTPSWITLGLYADPQGLRGIPYEDSGRRSKRLNEILQCVGAKFPLVEGVHILGSVIGRLSGDRYKTQSDFHSGFHE